MIACFTQLTPGIFENRCALALARRRDLRLRYGETRVEIDVLSILKCAPHADLHNLLFEPLAMPVV